MYKWRWYVFAALYVLAAIFFGRYVRRRGKYRMKDPEELGQIAFWAAIWWPLAGGGLLLHNFLNLLIKKSPEPEEEE